MSSTELTNLPNTLDALVAHLRETDGGVEHDLWQTADLTLAVMRERLPATSAGRGTYQNVESTFSELSFQSQAARDVAAAIRKELVKEGILVNGREVKDRTLLGWATNAQVWSPDERVEGASFYAHSVLRSPKYAGVRHSRLLQLREKASNGRVTETAVRDWVRDQKPAERQSFLEKVERRLRQAVKSAAAPWARTSDGDKLAIARTLRTIADEIETGKFK